MAKRPLIGIPCRQIQDPATTLESVGVRVNYINSIATAGGVPILLPLTEDHEQLRASFDACHGILLSGGEDVDPAIYKASAHPRLGAVCRPRDDIELALAHWCRETKKPLLGICRGLQVMNVAFGGTLFQDIESEIPNALVHNDPEGWETTPHRVTLSETSKLATILRGISLAVNTLHHQAIKDLAPGLVVSARSEDGVIEGIESSDEGFCIAVQWHPETLWQRVDPTWLEIFKAFVHASTLTHSTAI